MLSKLTWNWFHLYVKKRKKEEMNGIAIIVSPSYNNFEDKLEVINYKLILF